MELRMERILVLAEGEGEDAGEGGQAGFEGWP
jgi:hypothetical protein